MRSGVRSLTTTDDQMLPSAQGQGNRLMRFHETCSTACLPTHTALLHRRMGEWPATNARRVLDALQADRMACARRALTELAGSRMAPGRPAQPGRRKQPEARPSDPHFHVTHGAVHAVPQVSPDRVAIRRPIRKQPSRPRRRHGSVACSAFIIGGGTVARRAGQGSHRWELT